MSSTNEETQQKDENEVEPSSEEPATPLSSEKERVIEFAHLYSIDLACDRFGVTKNVLRGWLKQKNIPIKPVYNSPGQGRKISYSRELDSQIADHVRSLLEAGERVSVHDVCTYARKLIQEENPDFTASTGWAQRFLVRNNIDLSFQLRKLIPSNRQAGSNGSLVSSTPDNRGRPLSYPAQLDNSIADWVRQRTAKGDTVTNSELRKHAKEVISKENPNFTGSASWSQNFLLRHRLSLQPTTPTKNEERETTPPREEEPQSTAGMLGGAVDETVSNTLALLTSEGLPGVVEPSLSQGSGISLSDLTNESIIVDLLNNNNHDSTNNYSQPSLDTSAAYITLGQHLSDLVSSVNTSTNQNTLELTTPTPPVPSTSKSHSSSPGDVIGSGTRPLSYTKETDHLLAEWVKDKQATGEKVTFASLRSHARKIVSSENPNFSASVGWVTPFLLRHNLDLKVNNKKMKSTRKTSQPRKLSPKDEQCVDEPVLEALGEQSFTDTPSQATNQNTDDPSQQEEVVMVTEVNEDKFTPKGKVTKGKGSRSRHTLAEKLEVVRLMREYNLAGHYVSRLLGIATSTLSGWVKMVDQKGAELETLSTNRKRSNRAGQGRPLTYSREKDDMIAGWVRQQQDGGVPVTASDLSAYASSLIGEENSTFVASVGWRHKFLQRHNIQLQQLHSSYKQDQTTTASLCVPIPVQTEEVVCTDEFSIELNDKALPSEVLTDVLTWARDRISDNGSMSVQEFCAHSEDVILPIDPMFVATLGWAFKLLHTNGVFLDPKPTTIDILGRKRTSVHDNDEPTSLKKHCTDVSPTVPFPDPVQSTESPPAVSGGTLCQALLSLSQGQQDAIVMETQAPPTQSDTPSLPSSNAKNYFGKLAREFTSEEKEEVVRYANATTLQKAALRYGVAAPTVWRWRMELKLHQPKYTTNQKKYIVKFAETNSLKEAAQRFGITTKTVQNWRRSLQLDGTLSDVEIAAIAPPILIGTEGEGLATPTNNGLITEEVIPLDNSHFQFVVDGGEVAEATRPQVGVSVGVSVGVANNTNSSLEVVQVQDVGMEYDVVSSEGHAAKPRCTPEEKNHILQYALEHTIREASVKYGVSPGTLYYWKKNHLSSNNGPGGKAIKHGGKSEDPVSSSSLEPTVVSVPMTMDILAGGGLTADPLQSLSSEVLIDNSVPTASLIAAITQTLASATPEQLQSLQQITTDLNLLQAVTSIMNTNEGGVVNRPGEGISEGISSPTDVLVSFNPLTRPGTDVTNNEAVTMVTEETTTTEKNIEDMNSQQTEN